MPYTLHQMYGVRGPSLVWSLGDVEILSGESKLFPWLNKQSSDLNHYTCDQCNWLDFGFLFSTLLSETKILINGKECRVHPDGLSIGTVEEVEKRKSSGQGCNFCVYIWDRLCQHLLIEALPKFIDGKQVELQLRNVPRGLNGHFRASADLEQPYVIDIEVALSSTPPTHLPFGRASDNIRLSLSQPEPSSLHGMCGVRPIGADEGLCALELFKQRLGKCKTAHGGHDDLPCPPRFDFVKANDFVTNFIDVIDMKIVELKVEGTAYAVLSYVWGQSKTLQTTTANIQDLRQLGGLSTLIDYIPQTVKDAISACQRLGLRYLWVDAICIQQDSADKMRQIRNMDVIYASGELTIVAASGENADGGLPGVRQGSRVGAQKVFQINSGMWLADEPPVLQECVNTSVWNTRGWTFQERLLSEKMLVFTPDHVFFCCRHGIQAESDILDVHDHPDRVSCLYPVGTDYSITHEESIDFDIYARTVAEYTQRSLGFPDDILNAFGGVLSLMTPFFTDGRSSHGLFHCVLDLALLWLPTGPLVRRRSEALLLPSWAWCGWIGSVNYKPLLQLADRTRPITDDLQSFFIHDSLEDMQNASGDYGSGWTRNVSENGEIYYTCGDELNKWHCRPSGFKLDYITILDDSQAELQVKSHVAQFLVTGEHADQILVRIPGAQASCEAGDHYVCSLNILDAHGKRAGTVVIDGNTASTLKPSLYRFVAISRSTLALGDVDPAWDEGQQAYVGRPGDPAINPQVDLEVPVTEQGLDQWFDASEYPVDICWGLYNVIMISEENERLGAGKIHIQAFDDVCERDVTMILQ